MEGLDIDQLWRQIPPEEKFEIMASSHSRGTIAAFVAILVGISVAISLKQPWLIWASLLLSPVIFDAASVKAWKHLKPRVILEYLAARAAARRFAFSINSSKLGVAAIVRGELKPLKNQISENNNGEIEHIEEKIIPVWVALFHDALVVISEQAGGAKMEIGQLLGKNIDVHGESPSGMGEYAGDRNVIVDLTDVNGARQSYNITSRHPAALIVLEKKLGRLIVDCKQSKGLPPEIELSAITSTDDSDDYFNANF